MARAQKFIHAVWSGYALTTVSSLLNLITIPIALGILGKADFGLWSTVATTTALVAIFEMGMGPSLARFITDYKDDRANPAYAQFLKSVFFVGLLQSVFFGVVAVILVRALPGILGIEPEQTATFRTLLSWQFTIAAVGFPLRPLVQLLYAHQDIARINGCAFVSSFATAGVLVAGLQMDWGIYSYLASSVASFVAMQAGVFYFVLKLRLLPDLRAATVSLRILKPLAVFSGNVVLIVVGLQLINFAPTLIVNRHLGVEAMADWTVGTRLVIFGWQIIARMPGSSEPGLWEMFARGEMPRLRQRMVELVLIAGASAALLGAGIAAINSPFIELWTSARVAWAPRADVCFALWVLVLAVASCFNMTPGITKRVAAMKYVFLLEGLTLLAFGYYRPIVVREYWQLALVLFLCASFFRLPYGLLRTWRDLGIPGGVLLRSVGRVAVIAALLLLIAFGLRSVTAGLPALAQVPINSAAFCGLAVPLVYKLGVPLETQQRLRNLLIRIGLIGKHRNRGVAKP